MLSEIIFHVYGMIGLIICIVCSIISGKEISKTFRDYAKSKLDWIFTITLYICMYMLIWPIIIIYVIMKGIKK